MSARRRTILIAEDNPTDEALAVRVLTQKNLADSISVVRDGAEVLDYLQCRGAYADRDPLDLPNLLLLDLKLPKFDGHQVLTRVREDDRLKDLPVVIMTSSCEESEVLTSYRMGANAHVMKPVDFAELTEVLTSISHFWLDINRTIPLTAEHEKVAEPRPSDDKSMLSMAAHMTEMRDPSKLGHHKRVCAMAIEMARELALSDDQIEMLDLAAQLHDVGKVEVPSAVLLKPGKLGHEEFELVKHHPIAGEQILHRSPFQSRVARIVRQHHERLDGSGYPDGLTGDDICVEARVLAVADVVEAMSNARPYRPALSREDIRKELEWGRGVKYDPKAVDTCLRCYL